MIVPKLCHRCHDGNIRCLEPVAPSAHHHDYGSGEYEEAQDKEEPEEPLGVVTEIAAINTLNMAEEVAHLEAKGIIHAIRCRDDMQEASGAYKDIEDGDEKMLNDDKQQLKRHLKQQSNDRKKVVT